MFFRCYASEKDLSVFGDLFQVFLSLATVGDYTVKVGDFWYSKAEWLAFNQLFSDYLFRKSYNLFKNLCV